MKYHRIILPGNSENGLKHNIYNTRSGTHHNNIYAVMVYSFIVQHFISKQYYFDCYLSIPIRDYDRTLMTRTVNLHYKLVICTHVFTSSV